MAEKYVMIETETHKLRERKKNRVSIFCTNKHPAISDGAVLSLA
jgi:hypothetical protein